ncbi:MAG: hypothetical protein JST79_15635 [Acidobacteria bacterium]|jgi:hypothetical protein|nr:hypothetical protein [Acidobacteriota bacterium]
MKSLDLDMVPLQQAGLCVNCEMITATLAKCPACGSVALINIARALSSRGPKFHAYAVSRTGVSEGRVYRGASQETLPVRLPVPRPNLVCLPKEASAARESGASRFFQQRSSRR